jgi:predicted PurR-regulated permease PerM
MPPNKAEITSEERSLHVRGAEKAGRAAAGRADLHDRSAQLERAAHEEETEREINIAALWTVFTQAATVGIFVLLFFGFLDVARPILVPLVSAIVVGLMFGPLAALARDYHIPSWVTALVLTLLFLLVVNLVFVLMAAPLIEWIGKAPEIGQTIRGKLHVFDRPLAAVQDLRKAMTPAGEGTGLKVDTGGPNLITPAVTFLTPAIGQLLLFIGTLYFFLLGRDELRRYAVSFFRDRDMRLRMLRILNDVEHSLTRYLSIVAVIYFCMGCITAAITYVVGLPSPYVWGIVAFLLNFVPYIGPATMIAVLLGAGLVTFSDMSQALIAPGAYLAAATLEGHFITPMIVGRSLTLSPLTVFLALAFWTWIWGPVGAFLAVPLLIAILAALHHLHPKDEMNLPG